MLPPVSAAICGLAESGGSLETFMGVEKVRPPSVEWLNMTSRLPGVKSSQTTLMPPWLSVAMRGLKEKPDVLEMLLGAENVAPPSVERLNRILEFVLVSSSQTM